MGNGTIIVSDIATVTLVTVRFEHQPLELLLPFWKVVALACGRIVNLLCFAFRSLSLCFVLGAGRFTPCMKFHILSYLNAQDSVFTHSSVNSMAAKHVTCNGRRDWPKTLLTTNQIERERCHKLSPELLNKQKAT